MPFHDRLLAVDSADSAPEITNQFVEGISLALRWTIPIEISHQTDTKADIVQIIARDMSAIDLTHPTVPDLDFPIAG